MPLVFKQDDDKIAGPDKVSGMQPAMAGTGCIGVVPSAAGEALPGANIGGAIDPTLATAVSRP